MKLDISRTKRTRSLLNQLNIYIAIGLSALIKACGGKLPSSGGGNVNKSDAIELKQHKLEQDMVSDDQVNVKENYIPKLGLKQEDNFVNKYDGQDASYPYEKFTSYLIKLNYKDQEEYYTKLVLKLEKLNLSQEDVKNSINILKDFMYNIASYIPKEKKSYYFETVVNMVKGNNFFNSQTNACMKELSKTPYFIKKGGKEKDDYFEQIFKVAVSEEFKNEQFTKTLKGMNSILYFLPKEVNIGFFLNQIFTILNTKGFTNEQVAGSIEALASVLFTLEFTDIKKDIKKDLENKLFKAALKNYNLAKPETSQKFIKINKLLEKNNIKEAEAEMNSLISEHNYEVFDQNGDQLHDINQYNGENHDANNPGVERLGDE
jgi:hypothetical protein